MRSYIKDIIIFNDQGERKSVPLKPGVNIVTGDSKTGKSALIEIIDYCLCSTRCTIPKGKITDFSQLYVLVMFIRNNTYIVARNKPSQGGRMYFIEESADYEATELSFSYFSDKQLHSYKDVQYKIECALGLTVSSIPSESDEKSKKASLRNMVSYLFQHQNLIASKFALFYRFADFYKRKDVIEQFPVFAGMISQDYYSELIQLNEYKAELKRKQKKQKANQKSTAYIKENLSPLLENYFALINEPFDANQSLKEMIYLAKHLPEYDDSIYIGESGIVERRKNLEEQLESLRNEEREILLQIKSVSSASNTGYEFSEMLEELKQQTNVAKIGESKYTCPLCGHDCNEITERDNELIEATEWLDQELSMTKKYASSFSEDIRKLKSVHSEIEGKIKKIWKELKDIEEKYIKAKNLKSKREKIDYAKASIMLYCDMVDAGIFESVDEEIVELKEKIELLEKKIDAYDIDAKKMKAQTFLSDNMNRLADTLDFENEYRPINLNFGLVDESYDLYQHQNNKEKIYLYEMGSGANWVSCHIALFLSFLRYFTKQKNSPMPLFLFFDQPSQVYFPKGDMKDSEVTQADIQAVNKMYKTIFDEINSIGKDEKILPQILIVDHVDGNDMEIRNEFNSYVRCDWRNGEGLI